MRNTLLCLVTLFVTPLIAATALGQGQADAIISINGETLESDVATVYFNAENCADPSNTVYELRLANGDGVSQAYLWAGTQNAGCEDDDNRTDQEELCRVMPDSSPRTVGDNATITGLTLNELVNTGIVDCENTALEGQPYEIYAFRDEDPGGDVVGPEGFGVAPFTVDVTPPQVLTLTSNLTQTGSSFTIAWNAPTDSQSIAQYKLYSNTIDDPASAVFTERTEGQNARSITVTAADLNLAPGDTIYLYVTAVDMASVRIGDGNEGELSDATFATAANTLGFCDDPDVDCSGCSVSPFVLPNGQPSAGLWVVGLLCAIVIGWRLRR